MLRNLRVCRLEAPTPSSNAFVVGWRSFVLLSPPFQGELEFDESYFGPKRICGKGGRGAGAKTIVFGLLKRGSSVYTEIVPKKWPG